MRFKKGSKIEVFNKKGVPSGSWWPAEIISGNGHTYLVRYYRCSLDVGTTVERVPRKAIRPCPPPMEGLRIWVAGDIVEVFDDCSWKLAQVSGTICRNCLFVRLLGSLIEFWANLSDIRARQTWEDDHWVMILKDGNKLSGGMTSKLLQQEENICSKIQLCEEDKNLGDGPWISSTKKRPRECSIADERGASRKVRTTADGGSCNQLVAASTQLLHKKVDAVVSPQKLLGENYMHASLNIKTTGFLETHQGDGIRRTDDNSYDREKLDCCGSESVSSSVGSCSPSNSPHRSHHCIDGLAQKLDSCSDDFESSSTSGREPFPSKEALEEKIHQLELNAYKSTMVALYASGPISWDQEAVITNLRLMLHISNDEHLAEDQNWRLVKLASMGPR